MIEKKNGRPTQPGSHSVSYQRKRRKPKPILYRLAAKCKRLKWRRIAAILLVALFAFILIRYVAKHDEQPDDAGEIMAAYATITPKPTEPPTTYIFKDGDGYPVDMEALTNAWAAEAGFEKRYTLTDTERYEMAQVITAEAVGEPFAGKVAVAQCILQACEDDGIRPGEALKKYEYSASRPEATDEALEAVVAVFDFGRVATTEPIKYFYAPELTTSSWHESQAYVMTINNHKFFKEVQ